MNVNDATITLGSTVYLQAEAGDEMVINVVEGGAQVQTDWDVEYVPAGARVRVPLDDEGHSQVGDYRPEPYDYDRMLAVPIELLPREITIAPPVREEDIEELRSTPTPIPTATPTITPTSSIINEGWTVTQSVVRDTCGIATNSSFGVLLTFDQNRLLLGL